MTVPVRSRWICLCGVLLLQSGVVSLHVEAAGFASSQPSIQSAPSQGAAAGAPVGVPRPPQTFDFLWNLLKSTEDPVIALKALTGLLLSVITAWLVGQKKKLEARIAGPGERFVGSADVHRHRVIVLGIGGTGKTSLIAKLTAHPGANPRVRTLDFATYSIKQSLVDPTLSRDCHITVDDYRGQNPGDLVRAAQTAEAWPDYSALVLMVDLFSPDGAADDPRKPSPQWDSMRVQEHLAAWGDNSIDLVRGLAPKHFSYMCLFINKVDLLSPRTDAVEKSVKVAFVELINRLQARSGGSEFAIYVGSVTADIGVMGVLSDLVRTALPVYTRGFNGQQKLAKPLTR